MKLIGRNSPSGYMICTLLLLVTIIFGCANRAAIGGGPYDEAAPVLLKSEPTPNARNVKKGKVVLHFDEYIKVKDVSKKVIISPPQLSMPRISAISKRVVVELEDSLKPNTTYTIDFTDAIVDNNEENPLENFSYAFSTGETLDTMEISGHVIDAHTHEPIQGVVVGIHPAESPRTLFRDSTFVRMSRTSERSFFVIRNMKHGSYRVFALKETDGNYRYDNPTDGVAFLDSTVLTSSMPAMRNDTIRKDSIIIDTIIQVPYTRYLPDDIVLRYYTGESDRRFIKKRERKDSTVIQLEFNAEVKALPTVRPLGEAFASTRDSIGYIADKYEPNKVAIYLTEKSWEQADSFAVSYFTIDSLNLPVLVTDSLQLRVPKPKKEEKKEEKKPEVAVAPNDSVPSAPAAVPSPFTISFKRAGTGGTRDSMFFTTSLPIDTTALKGISFFSVKDSVLTPVPITRVSMLPGSTTKGLIEAKTEYKKEYEVHFDSLLFVDVYGNHLDKTKVEKFSTKQASEFSQFEVQVHGVQGPFIFELLSDRDQTKMVLSSQTPSIIFGDLEPGKYGLRLILDRNSNGKWDPGDYDSDRQPEEVYYAPKLFELKKNWKVKENWYPLATPLMKQKPKELIRTKVEDKKKRDLNKRREEEMRNRNRGSSAGGFGGGIGGMLGNMRNGAF